MYTEGSGSVRTGGGGNAREIKTRKTKKKNRREEESDDETGSTQSSYYTHTHTASFVLYMPHSVPIYCTPFVCIGKPAELVFLSVQEIMEVLEKQVCDTSEETLELIAHELVRYHINTPVPVLCYTGHHGNSNAIISFTSKQFVMVLFVGGA